MFSKICVFGEMSFSPIIFPNDYRCMKMPMAVKQHLEAAPQENWWLKSLSFQFMDKEILKPGKPFQGIYVLTPVWFMDITNIRSYLIALIVLFQKVDFADNDAYPKYNLYAYSEGKLTENARRMQFNGAPVIFVPGNSGSYKQV